MSTLSKPLTKGLQLTSGRAVIYGACDLYGLNDSKGVFKYASPRARVTARLPATRLMPPPIPAEIARGALLHRRRTAVTSAGLYAEWSVVKSMGRVTGGRWTKGSGFVPSLLLSSFLDDPELVELSSPRALPEVFPPLGLFEPSPSKISTAGSEDGVLLLLPLLQTNGGKGRKGPE